MLTLRHVACLGVVLCLSGGAVAFTSYSPSTSNNKVVTILFSENADHNNPHQSIVHDNRRDFVRSSLAKAATLGATAAATTTWSFWNPSPAFALEEEESFASIAARASKLSSDVGEKASVMTANDGDTRTAYDFTLPISGEAVSFKDIVRQSYDEEGRSKVKAILMVNMKEDDPVARKDIPEFISLASKYGRDGAFAVVMTPSDQGYYEPDTSQLIRLKLASEYGYGINPATVITDKVNFLGKTADPFWRWLQKNCRTPAGLGRIEGNFEKFLIDGRTGLPVRRYPRKYTPLDIKNDIEAILAGRPLPPAGANYLEQWRSAAVEAERDTYRFQKGLNYYD